jgi:hypothetical protein
MARLPGRKTTERKRHEWPCIFLNKDHQVMRHEPDMSVAVLFGRLNLRDSIKI